MATINFNRQLPSGPTTFLPSPNTKGPLIFSPNAHLVAEIIRSTSRAVTKKMRADLREETENMRKMAREQAPVGSGERRRRGTYRASIQSKMYQDGNWYTGEVGTDEPYGRRLEQGFIGRDARDRLYNQAPRRHFMPAFQFAQAALIAKMTNTLTIFQSTMFEASQPLPYVRP